MNFQFLLLCCFLSVTFGNIVKGPRSPPTRGSESFSVAPKQQKFRLNKKDTAVEPSNPITWHKKKSSPDLPSEWETKRLIRGLMRNSSTSAVNVNPLNGPTRFYRQSLLEYANDTASYLEDMKLIKNISLLTNPNNETRVISFALYGKKPKYNIGAIYNVEMAKVYFPGWKCRFYVADDAMKLTVNILKELGAEIEYIPAGMGRMMFWRFMIADDPKVDRYIIRDVDSRPNARDR
jgi:hypothetical protein